MSRLTAQELERSARVLLRRHGPDAPVEARRQAETCAPDGQSHWVATWLLIAELCEELLTGTEAPVTHPAG